MSMPNRITNRLCPFFNLTEKHTKLTLMTLKWSLLLLLHPISSALFVLIKSHLLGVLYNMVFYIKSASKNQISK